MDCRACGAWSEELPVRHRTEEYDEAWSLVDEDFIYKKGEWVEVRDFNEDRWQDSTTGIHFWLTREEAEAY